MRRKLAACFLIGLTAVACSRRNTDRGLGAGADSAGLRDTTTRTDTSMVAPAPGTTARPDTSRDSLRSHSSKRDASRPQTQSGVTDRSGRSTLGPGVKRTRPDQNEPVMAKGDTLSRSPDAAATDSLNRKALERITGRNDTMPQRSGDSIPSDSSQRSPTDSTHPTPADSTRSPTDSTRPSPTDSTRTPSDTLRPLPVDTTAPRQRDSTKSDSTQHH